MPVIGLDHRRVEDGLAALRAKGTVFVRERVPKTKATEEQKQGLDGLSDRLSERHSERLSEVSMVSDDEPPLDGPRRRHGSPHRSSPLRGGTRDSAAGTHAHDRADVGVPKGAAAPTAAPTAAPAASPATVAVTFTTPEQPDEAELQDMMNAIAKEAGVDAANVTLAVNTSSDGSSVITATVAVDGSSADAVEESLESGLGSAANASETLGVPITNVCVCGWSMEQCYQQRQAHGPNPQTRPGRALLHRPLTGGES